MWLINETLSAGTGLTVETERDAPEVEGRGDPGVEIGVGGHTAGTGIKGQGALMVVKGQRVVNIMG